MALNADMLDDAGAPIWQEVLEERAPSNLARANWELLSPHPSAASRLGSSDSAQFGFESVNTYSILVSNRRAEITFLNTSVDRA